MYKQTPLAVSSRASILIFSFLLLGLELISLERMASGSSLQSGTSPQKRREFEISNLRFQMADTLCGLRVLCAILVKIDTPYIQPKSALIESGGVFAQEKARTPTETVREFYRELRENRVREAFAMSIYRSAIEGLSDAELEELRPDFAKIAANVPVKVEITGEQISGDTATVFIRMADGETSAAPQAMTLVREKGAWIVGDRANQKVVRQSGKEFFFKARIDTHHGEAQTMLQRIAAAQYVYSAQHNKQFADLPALIETGLVPKDIETTESTGYRFQITLAKDSRNYTATAEPARYGRTGRLSFYMDQAGIKSKDTGGKPLKP